MNVFFRCDASLQIGTGHVMRCLTLAQALRECGFLCAFICRAHTGHLLNLITKLGFETIALPMMNKNNKNDIQKEEPILDHASWLGSDWLTDASQTIDALINRYPDWIIVDHYALDCRWESKLRTLAPQIMVIDDLADRHHDADILLDQNFYQDSEGRYQKYLPKSCKTLLGPDHALLRPEFAKIKLSHKKRNGKISRILIFFGGSDLKNQTLTVLETLETMQLKKIDVDVVVSQTNSNRHLIKKKCLKLPYVTYHCNVPNMAELIANADLGLGAGGSAMWERCYLGLPTITVTTAKNQESTTKDVASLGAIEYLGRFDSISKEDYSRSILSLMSNPDKMMQISREAHEIMKKNYIGSVVKEIQNFQKGFL